MSELEDLPSWAGRSADGQPPEAASTAESQAPEGQAPESQAPEGQAPAEAPILDQGQDPGPESGHNPQPVAEEQQRRPRRTLLLALLGLLALVGIGAVGYLLASSQDDSTETAANQQGEDGGTTDGDGRLGSEELASDEATETDGGATTDQAEAADETVAADTDDEGGTDGQGGDDTEAADADEDATGLDSGRQAIFRSGKVYLSGPVPSEEIGQLIEQKAAAVVGPDNVVNEYTIDPSAVIEEGSSAPLYVEDVVLFEFNSVAIAEPFLPILDLGTVLLSQNPQASVTVVTRTDALGSEEVNLEVSTRRADAVVEYWLNQGVNAEQIKTDPRGEELASEDDDAETAALNRRAEFIITGLLD